MTFICYDSCSTCKKAEKWLNDNKQTFTKRAIKTDNPTASELKLWHQKSGLALKRFFNTSGQLYREQNLKEKLPGLSEKDQYTLLARDGMLVKRPLLVTESAVLVGFSEKEWVEALLK